MSIEEAQHMWYLRRSSGGYHHVVPPSNNSHLIKSERVDVKSDSYYYFLIFRCAPSSFSYCCCLMLEIIGVLLYFFYYLLNRHRDPLLLFRRINYAWSWVRLALNHTFPSFGRQLTCCQFQKLVNRKTWMIKWLSLHHFDVFLIIFFLEWCVIEWSPSQSFEVKVAKIIRKNWLEIEFFRWDDCK